MLANKMLSIALASEILLAVGQVSANHIGSGNDPGSAISGADRSVSVQGANESERLLERQLTHEAKRRKIAKGGLKAAREAGGGSGASYNDPYGDQQSVGGNK